MYDEELTNTLPDMMSGMLLNIYFRNVYFWKSNKALKFAWSSRIYILSMLPFLGLSVFISAVEN